MFIIVDSGSSKADWAVVDKNGDSVIFQTPGINPATQKDFNHIDFEPKLLMYISQASNIFFYGAGVIGESTKDQIKHGFKKLNSLSPVTAEGDMLAAARACCGSSSGIVAILGTGSNSCEFDGKEISNAIPSLGYILSDEGGGVHIGKEILKAYFYGSMPKAERDIFDQHYQITKTEVIDHIYKSSIGSQYIASFAPFVSLISGEWKDQLVQSVFREFIKLRIAPYQNCNYYPIHFVGSIAYNFKKNLEIVLDEYGFKAGQFLKQPIQSLITYHYNKNNNNE